MIIFVISKNDITKNFDFVFPQIHGLRVLSFIKIDNQYQSIW